MMMALKYRNGCPAKTHQSSQLASQSTETAMARPRLEKVTAGCNLEEFTVTSASDQSYVLSVLEVIALVSYRLRSLQLGLSDGANGAMLLECTGFLHLPPAVVSWGGALRLALPCAGYPIQLLIRAAGDFLHKRWEFTSGQAL
jgi:hypothetical protein